MEIRRNQIYVVNLPFTDNSITRGNRPCIVVSNNMNNIHSPVIQVIPLTTSAKKKLPTHYDMIINGESCTALCENIISVDYSNFGKYLGELTPHQVSRIDKRLKIQLNLKDKEDDYFVDPRFQ